MQQYLMKLSKYGQRVDSAGIIACHLHVLIPAFVLFFGTSCTEICVLYPIKYLHSLDYKHAERWGREANIF